ncbi:MAG TPA: malate synthase A, partial [Roseiarcus sp.]
DDGREATPALFKQALKGEMERVKGEVGVKAFDGGRFEDAIKLFSDMSLADAFEEFLTLPAYKLID